MVNFLCNQKNRDFLVSLIESIGIANQLKWPIFYYVITNRKNREFLVSLKGFIEHSVEVANQSEK